MRGGRVFVAREARGEPLEDAFAAAIDDPDRLVVVGTIDDTPIGYAVATTEPLRDGTRLGVVSDLFVEGEARGIGVGEAMMTLVLCVVHRAWVQRVRRLRVAGRPRHQELLRGLGFHRATARDAPPAEGDVVTRGRGVRRRHRDRRATTCCSSAGAAGRRRGSGRCREDGSRPARRWPRRSCASCARRRASKACAGPFVGWVERIGETIIRDPRLPGHGPRTPGAPCRRRRRRGGVGAAARRGRAQPGARVSPSSCTSTASWR